jgi:predicted amidohydrolase
MTHFFPAPRQGRPPGTLRVAAVQFAAGTDVAENLATCLRLLDRAAAECAPDIVVTPEFANHSSWYADRAYSYAVAVDLEGDFLRAVAAKAAEHAFSIVINCTVRRPEGRVTGTNLLFGPTGALLATSDKQVLMGNENNFLDRSKTNAPLIPLGDARISLYSCMDGVINETPRGIALRGAQVLFNSLNSFASDEASLHIPVRAAENRVFVVAANKVGDLVPPHLAEQVAQRMGISAHDLHGAGESQIVAPDGTVLAIAPRTGEAVVWADIDPRQADEKRRPDGTDVFAARRPPLYTPIAQPPRPRDGHPAAARLLTASYTPPTASDRDPHTLSEEAAEAVAEAAAQGAGLIVLPELFCLPDRRVAPGGEAEAARLCDAALHMLAAALADVPGDPLVSTSIVEAADGGWAHTGVLVGRDGVRLRQRALHASGSHPWVTVLGDRVHTLDTAFGRAAVVVGGDSVYPETFRLAALQDCDVIALPHHLLERWEMATGLLERAAENRVHIVMASRHTPFGASAVFAVGEDFTLWTPWTRPFNGAINMPTATTAEGAGLIFAEVSPVLSENRMVTQQTDVVGSRPWNLAYAIIGEPEPPRPAVL